MDDDDERHRVLSCAPCGAAGPNDVFAVGEGGTVLHYDGVRWYPMPNPTTKALRAVWGTSPTDVYAAGEDGVLFRFNGSAWTALDSHTTQILLGLSGRPGRQRVRRRGRRRPLSRPADKPDGWPVRLVVRRPSRGHAVGAHQRGRTRRKASPAHAVRRSASVRAGAVARLPARTDVSDLRQLPLFDSSADSSMTFCAASRGISLVALEAPR